MKFKNILRFIYYIVFFSGLFGVLYLQFNSGHVYDKLANYYLNNHKINSAIECFEKSFENGNNDFNSRTRYVDTVIKYFPENMAKQEKLVVFAEDDIQDVASIRAKSYLYDLVRKVKKYYPNSYITHAALNNKIIRWNELPITYYYDLQGDVPNSYIKEIDAAFMEYQRYGINFLRFERVDNPSANIIIKFLDMSSMQRESGQKYVIAYTEPVISNDTLEKMVINFNATNFYGEKFTDNEIYNTALHEIFHALGFMGHSYNKNDVMYMSKDGNKEKKDWRSNFTKADVQTLELLYLTKPDITNNSSSYNSKYIPFVVLGEDEIVNRSKLQEAQYYVSKAPKLSVGYIDLAEAYLLKKDYQNSLAALNKAVEYADTNELKYMSFYNLAVVNFDMQKFEQSKEYITKAQLIKDTDNLHILLAEIYRKTNNINLSIKEYENFVNKYPNNIEYVNMLASLYVSKRQYIKARNVLKKYILSNPNEKNNPLVKQYSFLIL